MRVFVATRQGQGEREDDFFWGIEGELVSMPMEPCANPRCGCDRAVSGLASSKALTTFMSVDREDLDPVIYRKAFLDSLERQGWMDLAPNQEEMEAFIDWHIQFASECPENAVLRVSTKVDSQECTIQRGRGG